MNWIDFPDDRLKVYGLAWFDEEKPSVRRLPTRLKDTFRKDVWDLAQCPAGGRIRFQTDSMHVSIRAKSPDFLVMNHITRIGQSGFDIYADGTFMGSISPDENCIISADWQVGPDKEMRSIEISMPLYKSVEIESIGIDDGAKIVDPKPYKLAKPVVYYGTSITQGGCADTPGTSYQSFISRWLDIDFINIGFSGNGRGDVEVADAISEIDASCVVLDFWANVEEYGKLLPGFVKPIRTKYPEVPIIVISPFFYPSDLNDYTLHTKEREEAAAFVRRLRRQGDKHIHFFNGLKMLSKEQSYGSSDGVHPTSLGFYFMAKGFTPFLKRVLGL